MGFEEQNFQKLSPKNVGITNFEPSTKKRQISNTYLHHLPQHKKPLPSGCLRESCGSYLRPTAAATHRRLPQQLRGALPRCGGHGAHAGAAKAAGLGGSRHLGKTCGAEEVSPLYPSKGGCKGFVALDGEDRMKDTFRHSTRSKWILIAHHIFWNWLGS